MGMFGIHGALLAGKVAEFMYTDTEKALDKFKQFDKNYQPVRVVSAAMRRMPMRLPMAHLMMKYPRLMTASLKMIDDGIPGYDRHWAVDMMEGRTRVRTRGQHLSEMNL